MQGFTLKAPVTIPGRSAFGRKTSITLSAETEEGTNLVANGSLSSATLRHLVLEDGRQRIIRVPEHLFGILFAMRARVNLKIGGGGIPYDGTAELFYQDLQQNLEPNGQLRPVQLSAPVCVPGGEGRYVSFHPPRPGSNKSFEYRVEVEYTGIGKHCLEGDLDSLDLARLASARGEGRLKWLTKPLIAMLAQKRRDYHIWLNPADDQDARDRKLEEIAMHRLLDLCGALYCVCRHGDQLIGRVSTRLVGHTADVKLVNKLRQRLYAA